MSTYIKKYILGSQIIKNIVTISVGNVIGYVINAVSLPAIGRIYSKADIGNYDLLISTASIFMTLFTMALMLVIIIPEEDYEANGICKIVLFFSIFGVICLYSLLVLFRRRFLIVNTGISYTMSASLICIYILSGNIQSIFYSYLNRKGMFRLLFWVPIIMAVVNSGLSIVLGLNGLHTVGYMVATICAYVFVIIFMSIFVNPFRYKHSIYTLIEYLKKYKRFPLVQLPANFIELLAIQLPIQFFGREYSAGILGGYTMACKLLSMPVSLIGVPINKVYYKELVDRINRNEKTDGFVLKIIKSNYVFIAIPIGILMVFGEPIVAFFLGEEWVESGYYFSIIGFAYIINFCTQCVGGTFIATNHTNISFLYAIGSLIQYTGCFVMAHFLKLGFDTVLVLHTINTIINGFICIELVNKCVGGNKFQTTKILFGYLSTSAIVISLLAYAF